MREVLLSGLFTILLTASSCQERGNNLADDDSEATIASETGAASLQADVLALTKPLINGALYNRPSFDGQMLTHFDTSQQIQVLDTTDNMFVKARIAKDTTAFTGYVPKAILPEKR
ncbi:hypothetical protein ACFSKU_03585 [Pontibacter silvestris]|uniref:SH3 domain-containing protein n=1 Tax=Pontibacter silvestris TaxID=2305183 RepID=A0ABW4WVS2_9BACT|nr:hypothetical protein [Pontibacter silvestris]MCC9138767.1 hypothetical protein [Pontibacter silvestris]